MTARMHPAYLVLIGAAAALVVALPVGHHMITRLQPEPVLLSCPDVTPIAETRVVTLLESWPIPPEATPIPAPRRSVQRKRQTLIPPSMPAAEQCAPPPGFYGPGEPQVQHVPEPSSLPLALAGLAGVFALRRKEGKQ